MKIIILQGSPNIKGSTNILVEEFSKGAESAGHSVTRFDIDRMDIRPCTAENSHRPILCIQFQHYKKTYEVGLADCCME